VRPPSASRTADDAHEHDQARPAGVPPSSPDSYDSYTLGASGQRWFRRSSGTSVPGVKRVVARPTTSVARAAAIAVLSLSMVACTGVDMPATPASHRSQSAVASSTALTTTRSAFQPAEQATLSCSSLIFTHAPPPDHQVLLGVVGLPAAPRAAALQTGPYGPPGPRLFAKDGLDFKAEVRFELRITGAAADHVGIGWGNTTDTPTRRLIVPACPPHNDSQWLTFAGGYWLDHPDCITVRASTARAAATVRIGVGTACPGQLPPQGPSTS